MSPTYEYKVVLRPFKLGAQGPETPLSPDNGWELVSAQVVHTPNWTEVAFTLRRAVWAGWRSDEVESVQGD